MHLRRQSLPQCSDWTTSRLTAILRVSMRPWPFSTVSARATSGGGSSQGGSVAEGDGDVAMQLRLVRLHDEQVVALSVTHMAADLALGEDRIAGDDRTLQGQSLGQRQRRRN